MVREKVKEHIRKMEVKQNWLAKRMNLTDGALSLMLPITSEKDNEINVVRLFGYYYRATLSDIIKKADVDHHYGKACKEAYERLTRYIANNPDDAGALKDMQINLMKSALYG